MKMKLAKQLDDINKQHNESFRQAMITKVDEGLFTVDELKKLMEQLQKEQM